METMKQGDIFSWRWKADHPRREQCNGTGTLYWCMSQIAVVDERGELVDTYWHGRDGHRVGADDVDLEFIANTDDIVAASEEMRNYYADSDIVNLNHANSSRDNFYLRKGAKRCPDKIRASLNYKIECAEIERRSAERTVERCNQMLVLLDDNNLEEIYL